MPRFPGSWGLAEDPHDHAEYAGESGHGPDGDDGESANGLVDPVFKPIEPVFEAVNVRLGGQLIRWVRGKTRRQGVGAAVVGRGLDS